MTKPARSMYKIKRIYHMDSTNVVWHCSAESQKPIIWDIAKGQIFRQIYSEWYKIPVYSPLSVTWYVWIAFYASSTNWLSVTFVHEDLSSLRWNISQVIKLLFGWDDIKSLAIHYDLYNIIIHTLLLNSFRKIPQPY